MAFLEYVKRDTFFHNLHPLAKIVFFITIVILAGIWWDPRFLIPLLTLVACLYVVIRIPTSWLRPILAVITVTIPTVMWLSLFQVRPELYRVYPQDFVAREVFILEIPFLGRSGFTYGSIMWFLGWQLRTATTLLAVAIFTYSTSPAEISHLAIKLKSPYSLVYIYTITMRFIPYMSRILNEVVSVQKLRAWEPPGRNPFKFFRNIPPIARPFIARSFYLTDDVTMAAQIRAFGSGKITTLVEMKIDLRSFSLIVVCVIAIVVSVVGLFVNNLGLI